MTRRVGRRHSLGGVALVCAALVMALAAPPARADSEDQLRRKAQQLQAQIKAQAEVQTAQVESQTHQQNMASEVQM